MDDLQLVEFVWGVSQVASPGALPAEFAAEAGREAAGRVRLPLEERRLLERALGALQPGLSMA